MAEPEQLGDKLRLHQGFAAGYGHAACFTEVGLVPADLPEQLFGLHLGAGIHGPGIGIMAVGTPQRTPLQKHHKPDARSVHRAKALQ